MKKYDVIVIGSGTGGQTAAYDLKASGLDVALVERSVRPGGTCALYGCQPKKWFYETAEIIARSRHLVNKGLTTAAAGDWEAVWKQKQLFTQDVPAGTRKGLEKAGIDFVAGTAQFTDANSLDVEGQGFAADFFVVATGGQPAVPPIRGAGHMLTSTAFLERRSFPRRIVFVGAGFISFEFAHFLARIGPENRSITLLEVSDRPLALFDREMVDLLLKASAEDGIEIRANTRITAIDKNDAGFAVKTDGGPVFEADLVVNGAGRIPAINGLNLEKIGVDASRGGIRVNDRLQTTLPHIFAVGDCAATPALARVADAEAHIAARNISALRQKAALSPIDYRAVPFVLFSYPQYAMVGQTEVALQKDGIAYRKSTAVDLRWPTYRRVGLPHAGYKILAGEDNTILGAHVVSDSASGLINTFKQAIIDNTPVDKLYHDNIMSPYPSRESDIIYMLRPLLT